MSHHDYESVTLVLCTPLQVKCYRNGFFFLFFTCQWQTLNVVSIKPYLNVLK